MCPLAVVAASALQRSQRWHQFQQYHNAVSSPDPLRVHNNVRMLLGSPVSSGQSLLVAVTRHDACREAKHVAPGLWILCLHHHGHGHRRKRSKVKLTLTYRPILVHGRHATVAHHICHQHTCTWWSRHCTHVMSRRVMSTLPRSTMFSGSRRTAHRNGFLARTTASGPPRASIARPAL